MGEILGKDCWVCSWFLDKYEVIKVVEPLASSACGVELKEVSEEVSNLIEDGAARSTSKGER